MEIIHPYRDGYPFGLDKQTEFTYVQLLRDNLSQEQIHQYKLKNKLYREMSHAHLVKLVKIFRENTNLRFLYEYYPVSIYKYLEKLGLQYSNKIEVTIYKRILNHFISNIESITQVLVHYQIKKQLMLQHLVVSQSNDDSFQLKLFIEPQAQCLAINLRFSQENHDKLKQIIQKNKLQIMQFYQNEKKAIISQFQALLQTIFSKIQSQDNRPNFVINGSKLVFTHNNHHQQTEKYHKIGVSADKADILACNMHRGQKCNKYDSKMCQKNQLKQRNYQRIKWIKNTLSQLGQRNYNLHHKDEKNKLQDNYVDHINFKPEEITNDKTAIIEEKQYLQNLQQEIQHMNKNKFARQHIKQNQIRGGSPCAKDLGVNIKLLKQIKPQSVKTTDSLGQNEEKMHRYKMKIITSHDIQIQDAGDLTPMDMQRQIFQGMKSCKFNISNVDNLAIQPQPQHKTNYQNYGEVDEIAEGKDVKSRNSDFGMKYSKPQDRNQKKVVISLINSGQKYNGLEDNQQYIHDYQNCNKEDKLSQKQESRPQNYHDKIKYVKSKAEKILKQYARAKKQ